VRKIRGSEEVKGLLLWSIVFAPLFAFEFLMFGSLIAVLYYEFIGFYRMEMWQLIAAVFYTIGLVCATIGQIMLLEHIELQISTIDVPSILISSGLVFASIGLYIVCRKHVAKLMASRGGAVPVPLTRTSVGWVTNYAVTDSWILLGDIDLTADCLRGRNPPHQRQHSMSDIESDNHWCSRVFYKLCCCCRSSENRLDSIDTTSPNEHPEGRLKNTLRRTTSGSYSDVPVDIDSK